MTNHEEDTMSDQETPEPLDPDQEPDADKPTGDDADESDNPGVVPK